MMIMMTLVFGLIVLDIYNILNCVYQTIVDIYMINIYAYHCVVVCGIYICIFTSYKHICSTLQRVERRVCRALYNPGVKNVKREK